MPLRFGTRLERTTPESAQTRVAARCRRPFPAAPHHLVAKCLFRRDITPSSASDRLTAAPCYEIASRYAAPGTVPLCNAVSAGALSFGTRLERTTSESAESAAPPMWLLHFVAKLAGRTRHLAAIQARSAALRARSASQRLTTAPRAPRRFARRGRAALVQKCDGYRDTINLRNAAGTKPARISRISLASGGTARFGMIVGRAATTSRPFRRLNAGEQRCARWKKLISAPPRPARIASGRDGGQRAGAVQQCDGDPSAVKVRNALGTKHARISRIGLAAKRNARCRTFVPCRSPDLAAVPAASFRSAMIALAKG